MTQPVISVGSTVPKAAIAGLPATGEANGQAGDKQENEFLEMFNKNSKLGTTYDPEAEVDSLPSLAVGVPEDTDATLEKTDIAGDANRSFLDPPRSPSQTAHHDQQVADAPEENSVASRSGILSETASESVLNDVETADQERDVRDERRLAGAEVVGVAYRSNQIPGASESRLLPSVESSPDSRRDQAKLERVQADQSQLVASPKQEERAGQTLSTERLGNFGEAQKVSDPASKPSTLGTLVSGVSEAASQAAQAVQARTDARGEVATRRASAPVSAYVFQPETVAVPTMASDTISLANPTAAVSSVLSEALQVLPDAKLDSLPVGQGTSSTATTALTATPAAPAFYGAPPDVAKLIAQQMAVSVSQSANGATELQLSPAELGRVRIVLSPQDAGMVVSVYTERPEVHDLMRRHIDQLTQEFTQLGYDDVSFDFQQSDTQEDGGWHSNGESTAAMLEESTDPTETQRIIVESSLDLRV